MPEIGSMTTNRNTNSSYLPLNSRLSLSWTPLEGADIFLTATKMYSSICFISLPYQKHSVINAGELIEFRSSCYAHSLLPSPERGKHCCFSAGKQAAWQVRIAVLLRSREVNKITIINRSVEAPVEELRDLGSDHTNKTVQTY